MKEILKMLVNQFLIVTVSVMFFSSFFNLFVGWGFKYDSSYPWVLMLTGLVGTLPSLVLLFKREPTKKQFVIRCIIHYFLLSAAIIGEGVLIGWFENMIDVIGVWGELTIVYIIVWLFTYFSNRSAKKIVNDALKKFNEDEK